MSATVKFTWNKKRALDRMRSASERTIGRLSKVAHEWWLVEVPVGHDTKHHKAGQLRDSWFAVRIDLRSGPVLLFGSTAPYTIYVELGTGKMSPRAPIRKTAGDTFPYIESLLREELAS